MLRLERIPLLIQQFEVVATESLNNELRLGQSRMYFDIIANEYFTDTADCS